MLKLEQIREIRELKQNEHLSNSKIAKIVGVTRRSVANALVRSVQLEDMKPNRKSPFNRSAGKVYLDYVNEILVCSQSNKNPKDRITAAAIYQRLQESDPPFLGYPPVSKRTIERIVRMARKGLNMAPYEIQDHYLRLEHEKGSAQADFGEMDIILNHRPSKIFLFLMVFPYSNRKFACALPAQNFECLAEGINRIFTQIQGVPRVIRFDNMSTAVAQVKVDEDTQHSVKDANGKYRKLTDGFAHLVTHYRFGFEFCNVRAGHEKGAVEQAVNWFRSRFFAITREFDGDYDKLNDELFSFCERYAQNHHYKHQNETMAERFERERAALLPLPSDPFVGVVWLSRSADKYGKVRINNNDFNIGASFPSVVRIRCTWNTYEFFVEEKKVLTAKREYEQGKDFILWEAELSALIKKPTAFKSSTLGKVTPPEVKEFILKYLADDKRRIFTAMKDLIKDNQIEPVVKRLSDCVALYAGSPLNDFICRFYAYGEERVDNQPKLRELEPMARGAEPVNLSQYDKLME